MTIGNVGDNSVFRLPENNPQTTKGPDHYPAYGDKSPLPCDDRITLTSKSRPKSDRKRPLRGEGEGPDNYPNYGGKSKTDSPETDAIKSLQKSPIGSKSSETEGPDHYPTYGDKSASKPDDNKTDNSEGPDHYPNYGDKPKPQPEEKPPAESNPQQDNSNLPVDDEFSGFNVYKGPDNYPNYGGK